MSSPAQGLHGGRDLILPILLLAVVSAALLFEAAGRWPMLLAGGEDIAAAPETVVLPPGTLRYHPAGDYEQEGNDVPAPLQQVRFDHPLEITKYQVSAADYAQCVAARACKPAHPRYGGKGNVPAAGVSFDNAQEYAEWLSRATGQLWRLPNVAEWDFAADGGDSDRGSQVLLGRDPRHPWLVDLDTATLDKPSPMLRPQGGFGANARGVADMSGNVWEWTSDCYIQTWLAPNGSVSRRTESCGVRIMEGLRRMPMSVFVQDARSGGCLATVPPDNLGFRLVRERVWYDGLAAALRYLVGRR